MKFHVEQIIKTPAIKRIFFFLMIFLVLQSCIGAKAGYQIDDYYVSENGKEILGTKPLNAFIFENNLKNLPFEQFLAVKYKLDSYLTRDFWVTIDKNRYKILVYDFAEFDKYFGTANFAALNQENIANIVGGQPKFIAISMITDSNEDCLSDKSIFQNMAINYLKKLKDEYISIK
ncbi:hypothetical protein [uncultured Flavobacterium sp.]|uniref:hypothetical protein n=1 Tax=uncultured Flavobacterium sp. TaxID=165435 RepID=UPI0025D24C97|nr:hypothetical protein [uncultured Flavobacterium sp.]